tara:strand:+ start:82 stop:537 length:456 start_codon:yes stop_codon:yes gene_type:complete
MQSDFTKKIKGVGIKIFFDENTSPYLAKAFKILQKRRNIKFNESFSIHHTQTLFEKGIEDENWIEEIGKENGVAITYDTNIHKSRIQRELYLEKGVGIFFMKRPISKGPDFWEQVKFLVANWEVILSISKGNKPFSYRQQKVGKNFFEWYN